MARILLSNGANIEATDDHQGTPLSRAIQDAEDDRIVRNQISTIDNLLENGAEINPADNGGRTAWIWRVRNHASKAAETLLKHGASTEARAPDGDTALLMAASTTSDRKMVGLLLRFGAAVDHTDAHGLTPLLTSPLLAEAGPLRALVEGKAIWRQRTLPTVMPHS
ncbi:Ankyrin repeat-containing domain protein [Akanthomyces lecanii RCEF 1005]|uniref:Ankyrin repeat-containing domain protein n=1 Tax=Akanthomyces lecanii RCEF 1005 TaxID=1081108 RepID=A0A162IT68_CORDF|nr:Ankyrin repeat-containing domain protein [Akanthomyces lecanii RCEF 1005]